MDMDKRELSAESLGAAPPDAPATGTVWDAGQPG